MRVAGDTVTATSPWETEMSSTPSGLINRPR
jgi:hypothetical protein